MLTIRVSERNGHPILDQFSEDGFVDCVFRITERSDHEDHYDLVLRASHNGNPVGMRAWVRRGIRGGFDADMNLIQAHVHFGGVRFSRIGPESDRLLEAIAELYRQPSVPMRMVEELSFTAISLHDDGSVDMETDPVKLKLFAYDGPEEPEGRYFESFFNIDLQNGLVFWNEKDQDYCTPLVGGLSTTRPT